MPQSETILVCGAGGFIGGHLVHRLLREGQGSIRAVDIKPVSEWHQHFPEIENLQLDLSDPESCRRSVKDTSVIYNLAADMGGMGFIEQHKALCMLSVLINTQLLAAARSAPVRRYFYASSACVYNGALQTEAAANALKESDAYPAMPEDGYGWEKLFSERMCRHFSEDFGVPTRIARYHNVYGPFGTFDGGREKAPAAICRKIATAKLSGDYAIEIWGDGEQTRSFMFIDDCLDGTRLLTESAVEQPVNIGSSEAISINRLVDIVEEIAGIKVARRYNRDAPRGVNGRNSDNTLVRKLLDWEPTTSFKEGIEKTYRWIHDQISSSASFGGARR
jgi:GDP-D-mannose 3',5'-epimerase